MTVPMLKLSLALKGRAIREYTFVQDLVAIGRDTRSDICIDNLGVSRTHAQIRRGENGWLLEDCRSANGTWRNGRKVERELLCDGDEITIGKFSLAVSLPADWRAGATPAAGRPAAAPVDGTTVLTRGQLAAVLQMAREGGPVTQVEDAPVPVSAFAALRRRLLFAAVIVAAMAVGALLTALVKR